MTVFAIIAPSFNEGLEQAVKSAFPERWYVIAPGQYLVSADRTTATQVMEKLRLSGGERGRAMVLRLTSYTGWHAKDMWEWIDNQVTPSPPPASDIPGGGNE